MRGIRAGLLPCLALVLSAVAGAGETGPARHAVLESMGASVSAYKDYMLNCGGCHRYDGEGVARNAVPSFRNSIGLRIADAAGLDRLLDARRPGDRLALHVFRRDELRQYTVRLGKPAALRHQLRRIGGEGAP